MSLLRSSHRLLLSGNSTGKGLMRGLVAYWPLAGGSGVDLSGFGNHLTASASAPTSAVGPSGRLPLATQFTRANSQSFNRADNTTLSVADIPFMACGWIYLDSKPVGGFQTLLSHWRGLASGQSSWVIQVNTAADRIQLVSEYNASGVLDLVTVSADALGSPSLATWYFVFAWHDPDANTLNLQVNNGVVNSGTRNGGCVDSTASFGIGRVDDPGSFTDGRLAGLCFWKHRVPTATERSYMYNRGQGRAFGGSRGFV